MACKLAVIVSIAVSSYWLIQVTSASAAPVVRNAHVTLYDHADHEGEVWSAMDIRGCKNLDHWFNDRASSVNTHNTCVQLCEHGDCGGECRKFSPKIGHHGYLGHDFNDKTSSVKPC